MTVRDLISAVDERIFASGIVLAVASFGTHRVNGAFFRQPRELELLGGGAMAVGISFECQFTPAIATLAPQDSISIDDYGSFRFLRELIPGGDETGLTIIELGEEI